MPRIDTRWKYYFSDRGETVNDARIIWSYYTRSSPDASLAAELASEQDWEDGGDELTLKINVVSPEGKETTFTVYREMDVIHRAYEEKAKDEQ